MPKDSSGPERRSPTDGLDPTDFVRNRNWPYGALVVPQRVADFGLTREQLHHLMAYVKSVRQLALDYGTYLKGGRTTQRAVAQQLGLNANRLSALAHGTGWPGNRTYVTLRNFIPPEEQMRGGDFTPGSGRH